MVKYFFLFATFLVAQALTAQRISHIDFDDIRQQTTDSTHAFFYPQLADRLVNLDTSLSSAECQALYYGNVFQDNYHPYGATAIEKKFNESYNRGDSLSHLTKLAQEVMQNNPINLELYYRMIICSNRAKDQNSALTWAKLYVSFLEVIYASGTGKTCDQAFVVISVDDEYRIAADLGLKVTKQSLIGTCDRLQFSKKGQKRKNRIKTLYFDVQMPLSYLSGSYKQIDQPLPDRLPDEEE